MFLRYFKEEVGFLIDGTLIYLADYLILEAMILTCLGYLNFYIPKEQRVEAEEYGAKKDDFVKNLTDNEDIYRIKIQTRIQKTWFFVLSFIALAMLWIEFFRIYFNTVALKITSGNILNDMIIVLSLVLMFLVSVLILFISPLFGGVKAIEYYKKFYMNEYGVVIVD